MEFEVIKLAFKTPLHIGRGWGDLGHSDTILHSDTIKSAIYATGHILYPGWINKPKEFFNGFNISSCYPYAGDELFLPKLQLHRNVKFTQTDEHLQAKKAKKIEYFSINVFEEYINNHEININENQLTSNGKYVFGKKLESNNNIIISNVEQRVSINDKLETDPFYIDRIFFQKDCGLYFLITYGTKHYETRFCKP